MKNFKLIFFLAAIGLFSAWWWSRSTPWEKAQRALDKGEPGRAVEILVKAMESKDWPPEKEEMLLEMLAMGYVNKGVIDPAEKTYRSLQEKYPNNFDAALGLGALSLMRGMDSFALQYLNEAKRIRPNDIRSYVLLARLLINRRDYEGATSTITEGLLLFPSSDRLVEISGDLMFNQGRYIDALSQYSALLDLTPSNQNLKIKVARTYLFAGDLISSYDLLSTIRPLSGTDEGLELLLSNILHRKGERKEAANIAERLYREDQRRFDSGLTWVAYLGSMGRMVEAEDVLTRIGEALLPLGAGYSTPLAGQTLSDLERLQGWRETALRHQIFYSQVRSTLAIYKGRYSEAQEHLERAINIDTGDFGTIEKMTELFRLKNDPVNRLKWANRALSIYNNHPAAHLMRAKVYLDLKRNQDAIFDTRIVVDSYPSHSLAQAILSRAWMMQGNVQPSLEAAKKAVHLNSGDPEAQLSLAIALAESGKTDDSNGAFITAIDIDPRFAEARFEWATRLKKQGRIRESDIQYAEAERLEPLLYNGKRKLY